MGVHTAADFEDGNERPVKGKDKVKEVVKDDEDDYDLLEDPDLDHIFGHRGDDDDDDDDEDVKPKKVKQVRSDDVSEAEKQAVHDLFDGQVPDQLKGKGISAARDYMRALMDLANAARDGGGGGGSEPQKFEMPKEPEFTDDDLKDPAKLKEKMGQFFVAKSAPLALDGMQTKAQAFAMQAKNHPHYSIIEGSLIKHLKDKNIVALASPETWRYAIALSVEENMDKISENKRKKSHRGAEPEFSERPGTSAANDDKNDENLTLNRMERFTADRLNVPHKAYAIMRNKRAKAKGE